MESSYRKLGSIFLVIVLNTALLGLIIAYDNKNISTYNPQSLVNDGQERVEEIYSVEDYLKFAESVTEDNDYNFCKVTLYADLDFSGYEDFPVIGLAGGGEEEDVSFMGTFDGNGHILSGIEVDRPGQTAGMFAKLGGIVKNLQIRNSYFHGGLCGAVAAESYEGSILNCYVDAKVIGDIGGTIAGENYDARIINCVAASDVAGENRFGKITHCYMIGQEDMEDLNRTLLELNGLYRDAEFCRWEVSERGILSSENADLLEKLTARLYIKGKKINFEAYYSEDEQKWCFALPAGYGNEELTIEAKTSKSGAEVFRRRKDEAEILFTGREYQYLIGFQTADQIDSFYITLDKDKTLEYVHANKKEEIQGHMMLLDADGGLSYETIKSFYGHGNDSWKAEKKSYNLKFDSRIDLLGMGENANYVLLAGYRKNSMMSFCVNNELTKAVGFDHAPEYRMVNLYVEGEYVGVYFLTERMEIDENRIDIDNLYEETRRVNSKSLESFEHQQWRNSETSESRHYYNVETNPEDITGGYLLELDFADYEELESRFATKYKRSKIVLKRAWYSSEEQVNYIADLWQDFEDALYSESGCNDKGKRYTDYIDMESFAMQWLMYELTMEDSLRSSVYFYKESDVTGDGLLHACYPWDVERSYIMLDQLDTFWNVDVKGGYLKALYAHEDFRETVKQVWNEKFIPAIECMTAEEALETEDGLRNLSWYEEHLEQISALEHSRWTSCDMLEKCETIRNVLTVRKDFLSLKFQEE